ncbi:MAG: enoyl-CoA hydratase/isomerase family protein [Streptosporangiaceae bacterium]|nr:enoyl-CoA hydratase/isomerase family protein [Streptosporangiaceae bacterium]MBV9854019.1 enoyl-CoA hydratase/isomerase family protein [Streptosporangiaceae bacterium]
MTMPELAGLGRTGAGPVLQRDDRGGAARFRLNRPLRNNCLNSDLCDALLAGLLEASADPAVRVIVITGAGDAFCSGEELDTGYSAVPQAAVPRAAAGQVCRQMPDLPYLRICEAILHAPKPVIAGINGVSAGAGTEIACAADYRLAADTARIGSFLTTMGQLGNAVMLPRVVGWARATEIYLTGRLVPAAEAAEIGLVNRTVVAEDLDAELDVLAARLASGPTKAIGMYKELRDRAWGQPVEYGLHLQGIYHRRADRELSDGAEGVSAFLEDRLPRFSGE